MSGWVSLYSHGSPCFLGKDNALGQGSGVRAEGGWGSSGRHFLAWQPNRVSSCLSLRIWGLFISRMSIMSCHPTGKPRETSRKSITKQCVDQWQGSRHTLLWHCCPLVVLRTQRRHDELHFLKLSFVIVSFLSVSLWLQVCTYWSLLGLWWCSWASSDVMVPFRNLSVCWGQWVSLFLTFMQQELFFSL